MGIPYRVFDTIFLGPLAIRTWGLMVSLGFLVGLLIARRRARRIGMRTEQILDLGLAIIISAILGSRLFFVLNEWDQFRGRPLDALKFWDGGFAFYGGLAAAVAASIWYVRRQGLPFVKVADAFLPAVALGEAIGRVGCFLIHDHLGRVTTFPLAINVNGVLRHETGAYASLNALLLFGFLLLIEKVWKHRSPGTLTLAFLVWYGITTFAIYGLRADDLPGSDPRLGPFTPSQYVAALTALIGLALMVRKRFQRLPSSINQTDTKPL